MLKATICSSHLECSAPNAFRLGRVLVHVVSGVIRLCSVVGLRVPGEASTGSRPEKSNAADRSAGPSPVAPLPHRLGQCFQAFEERTFEGPPAAPRALLFFFLLAAWRCQLSACTSSRRHRVSSVRTLVARGVACSMVWNVQDGPIAADCCTRPCLHAHSTAYTPAGRIYCVWAEYLAAGRLLFGRGPGRCGARSADVRGCTPQVRRGVDNC